MESSASNNFAKTGQTLADKAANKVESGISSAEDTGSALSNKVDDLRNVAGSALAQAVGRGKQSLDAITDMASQARDVASNASDSIVAYTKKNPVTALAIAAASGALLYAVVKALAPLRDLKRPK